MCINQMVRTKMTWYLVMRRNLVTQSCRWLCSLVITDTLGMPTCANVQMTDYDDGLLYQLFHRYQKCMWHKIIRYLLLYDIIPVNSRALFSQMLHELGTCFLILKRI